MKFNQKASDIDRAVGVRIRELRIERGLTQEQMADALGVTYQQAHKYERGINRISAGRLWQIAALFQVPVDDLYAHVGKPAPSPVRERLTLDMARDFSALSDRSQEAVRALVRSLAPASSVAAE